jgi:hypothetical protein
MVRATRMRVCTLTGQQFTLEPSMSPRTSRPLSVLATPALAALLLAGCAGAPLVDIKAPGQSLMSSDDKVGPAMTLTEARRYLMRVRGTYRDAMATQTNTTQYMGSALIGLGALVTGLAAGQAHRDAILGASLIGGTSFAIGSLTLDQRRVLAFDAGIRALDCANAAVIPLDLDSSARAEIKVAGENLAVAIDAARTSGAKVRTQIDALANPELPQVLAAGKALTALDGAMVEAEKARKGAHKLAGEMREVGQRLQSTVNEISAKVDGVIVKTVPDLSAVQQAVGGLGGFVSAFAPGAELDKSIADAFGKYKSAQAADQAASGTPKANSGSFNTAQQTELKALDAAVAELDAAGKGLQVAAARVNSLVGSIDSTAVAAALKACNVADVILPLALEPATLTLDSTLARGFAISGGSKPYTVRLLDGAVDGLNINFGGGFADSAQVGASASVPNGSYRVLISDSAGTRNSKALVVAVERAASAAAPGTPTTAAATDAAAVSEALKNLARSLNDPGFGFNLGEGVAVKIKDAGAKVAATGAQVEVPITCTPTSPATKLVAEKLRAKLLSANPQSAETLKQVKDPVVIKPANAACVAAG